MKDFPRIMTDVNAGWKDDVGSSLTSYAVNLASAQQQACDAIRAVLSQAEVLINDNTSYKSQSSDIDLCKVD